MWAILKDRETSGWSEVMNFFFSLLEMMFMDQAEGWRAY